MEKKLSCRICYEPVFMGGCCEILPIVACETKRARKIAHRRKAHK
ncbi:MAG: hypothetical protein PHQ57_07290 [Candidatus Omnitrophica bacterium]|nr:hypothetical protein [Candidatus Omnitrophota bacterium]